MRYTVAYLDSMDCLFNIHRATINENIQARCVELVSFFAQLPEGEEIMPHQYEIIYATYAQIEAAMDERDSELMAQIPGLKSLSGRTHYVGDDAHFARGCRSCLIGTGLNTIRKTNQMQRRVSSSATTIGVLDCSAPIGEGHVGNRRHARLREGHLTCCYTVHTSAHSGVAYVYLEPFMEIEGIATASYAAFHAAGIHQHMYTNGTLANEENLRALARAGTGRTALQPGGDQLLRPR